MEKGDVRYLGLLPFHFIGKIFIDKISIHRKKVLAIYTLAQKQTLNSKKIAEN